MRIIVTGASGFIGTFLVEALVERGETVAAWWRDEVDITDAAAVARAAERDAPDVVVHLAAQSLPGRSWDAPAETYDVNVIGTINLLESLRSLPSQPRVLLAGSSAEYAEPADGLPIREDARIDPNSPYGSSKSAAMQLGEMYWRRYGLPIVRFRPFAFVGPRKTGDVCSDFARRIVAIEGGADPEMRVGELRVVRDMIDVRDGISAICTLIESGIPGEIYNICAGRGVSVETVLDTFCRLASVPVAVKVDPTLLRPLEQKVKIGDPSKLQALGWRTVRELPETLTDIFAYWRAMKGTLVVDPVP